MRARITEPFAELQHKRGPRRQSPAPRRLQPGNPVEQARPASHRLGPTSPTPP
jgi:hypothetical protein